MVVEPPPLPHFVLTLILLLSFINRGFNLRDYCAISARKRFDVNPPTLYLPEGHKHAKEYNCIQRSHQNLVTERIPIFLAMLLVASLFKPKWAAGLGALRLVSMFAYAKGYQTGTPNKRLNPLSTLGILTEFCLLYMCAWTVYSILHHFE